ncbi:MAG: UvrD-helicase domain-containing protein [Burkholderiaceae bacterium]|nr:UvrD-helicase domain-containing protein [Burkholderiaceae bacterium]
MNPIEFISAGAGSGKTYRLTTILSEALAVGSARPAGIVAMTFTIKAAAELRQRARKALLERGHLDLSTAIGQSRIGTVNAVCNQLLQRHCFELGHSPDQTVLAEAQSIQMLRRALEEVLDPTQREALIRFGDRFDLERNDWDKPVRFIVDAARANGIDAVTLQTMGPANANAMLTNWPPPQSGGRDLTAELARVLSIAHAEVEKYVEGQKAAGQEPQKNTLAALNELRECREDFSDGAWMWKQWVGLTKLNAGAKLRAVVQPVVDAAAAHEQHPEFHGDVQQYLALVFNLAASALASYEAAKREAGAQDFTDQEMLLLRALHESETVRTSLAEELDLVLVDEFQDTSPIQLAVFVELAKLAKRSVWVGDPKQAIYGFRGTDAGLIASVLDAIPLWGGSFGAPLTSSRRSVPSLVKLANEVFTPAFPKLKPDAVRLTPVRAEHPTQPSILAWTLESNNVGQDFQALGPAVTELLASGMQVQDTESGEWRSVEPGDIAVLCRYNYHIPLAAASLHQWGLPCVSTRPGLLSTPEATLVLACLRRLHDPADTAATAHIVSLTGSVPPEVWLADRLKHVHSGAALGRWQAEGPEAHPLVSRLEALRGRLAALTPFEALCLAKSESGVWRAAAQWSSAPKEAATRTANVEALLRMASAYEDECRSSKRPATVAGLLQWFVEQGKAELDARASATSGAVEVLTNHSAKGLEWPIVVLTGMDSEARSGLWDVRTRTSGAFDAQEPLRGRFVHYWPRPYGPRRMPDVLKRAQESPLGMEMQGQAADEHSRLLYVSCTRARDVMVLAVHRRKAATAWTDGIKASNLLFDGEGDIKLSDGSEVRRLQRVFSLQEISAAPSVKPPLERRWFVARSPQSRAPLWLRPSAAATGTHGIKAMEVVGSRIPLKTKVDMAALGSAIHNSIAFCLASQPGDTKDSVAAILARWRVGGAVEPDAVVAQAQGLVEWAKRKWPGAQFYVEAPVEVRLKSGQVVRGQIDLLLETGDGWVLIDHKADPRSTGGDDRLAEAHGAQLGAYAEAIVEATGRQVIEQWLFLPVAAQAAQIEEVVAA